MTAKAEIRFHKDDILKAEMFRDQRDLLSVILDAEKSYTKSEVKAAIEKYQKGKVM